VYASEGVGDERYVGTRNKRIIQVLGRLILARRSPITIKKLNTNLDIA
jgi:hypothetical protein